MSDVQSLIAGLVKEPGLLSSLVKDPQAIARLARLADPQQRARQEIGRMVANVTTRLTAPTARQTDLAGQAPAGASQSVALTGILALAAVAGGVAVVGVVSLVALSTHPEGLRA